MNFVEGTRFQPSKHQKQNSPFKHLLRPKAGGMAFALSAMGDQIHKLVDVTIYYPGKIPSFGTISAAVYLRFTSIWRSKR